MLVRRLVVMSLGSLLVPLLGAIGPAASADSSDRRFIGPRSGPAADSSVEEHRGDETISMRYSSYRYHHVPEFNLCLGIYMTSTLTARYKRRPISQGAVKTLSSPEIHDPEMQVTLKKTCDDNSAYKKRHRANRLRYANYYYGHSCSYNPSFSVGAPWSAGVGVTPDCGQRDVAKTGVTERGTSRTYRFNLDSDGYAFGWDAEDAETMPGTVKLCTSVSAFFMLHDNLGAERLRKNIKVGFPDACVSK